MDPTPFDLLTDPAAGPVIAAVWGALWGSFLNVVIERLPRGESVLRPASHCMRCEAPIRAYDNIPLVSYLVLRGRCRHCGARFSAGYLVVELLGLALSLACFHHAVTLGSGSAALRLASYLVEFFFALGLLAIVFIDIRTMIIPDAITLPMLAVLPAAAIALGRLSWRDALIGAALGFGVVWLLRELWLRLRHEEGIGLGDGKLLAVVGGVLGWPALPLVLLLGSVQGLLVAVPLRLLNRSVLARQAYQGTAVRAREGAATDEPPSQADEPRQVDEPPEAGEALDEPASSDDKPPPAETKGAETKGAETKGNDANPSADGADGADGADDAKDDAKEDVEKNPPDDLQYDLQYDEVRGDAVPFGPFLALAAIELLFFGQRLQQMLSSYLSGGPLFP